MEDKQYIEIDIADTIIERPIGFNLGKLRLFIYPPTLGKTYLLARLFKALEANERTIAANPYLEALRLCTERRDIVCRILSYYTLDKKRDILDNDKVESRARSLGDLDNDDLATLLMIVFSGDRTEEYVKYLGIDKEAKERKRVAEAKKCGGVSFGGKSIYGTLIDFACQRYGWTMDHVVWGISYANLRMLMADAITTVYLSAEERRDLHVFDGKDLINADDPGNKELIRELIGD